MGCIVNIVVVVVVVDDVDDVSDGVVGDDVVVGGVGWGGWYVRCGVVVWRVW